MSLAKTYLGALGFLVALVVVLGPPYLLGMVYGYLLPTPNSAWMLTAWVFTPLQWHILVRLTTHPDDREPNHIVAAAVALISIFPFIAGLTAVAPL